MRQRIAAAERERLGGRVVARRDAGAGRRRRQQVAVAGKLAAGNRYGRAGEREDDSVSTPLPAISVSFWPLDASISGLLPASRIFPVPLKFTIRVLAPLPPTSVLPWPPEERVPAP